MNILVRVSCYTCENSFKTLLKVKRVRWVIHREYTSLSDNAKLLY